MIMVEILLLLSFSLTFFCSVVLTRWWIKRAHKAGLVGSDMHKISKRKVAEVGGLPVMAAFLIGLFLYIGVRTFLFNDYSLNMELLAVSSTILLVGLVGMIDDILGWKIGLRQWQKPILCCFAALPMMVINAGVSVIDIPFLGEVNLGILFPLLVVPLAVSGAANAFNMIAGYNGLEAGQGILILFGLGFIVWKVSLVGHAAMIAAIMICALLGFLMFNWYPAKIFPGDTLTYVVGATIATVAIMGNAEKAALIIFIPYFLQLFLKLGGGLRKESFSKLNEDGSLSRPYNRIYAIEHMVFLFKQKIGEKGLVISMFFMQAIFLFIAFIYVL